MYKGDKRKKEYKDLIKSLKSNCLNHKQLRSCELIDKDLLDIIFSIDVTEPVSGLHRYVIIEAYSVLFSKQYNTNLTDNDLLIKMINSIKLCFL